MSTDPVANHTKWRPLRLPLGLIAVGVLMTFIGPLSGIGLLVVVGGAIGLGVLSVIIWLAG